MLTPRLTFCGVILALASTCLGAENAFREMAPDIAIAKPDFVEKNKEYLLHAERSWSPTDEQVLAAVSLLRSERGKHDTLAKATLQMEMERALARIDKSRFQVFGIIIAGRKRLFVDATLLQSDAPAWWLTEWISHNVLDGGAAYWWVLFSVEPLSVVDCNRRSDI